jgi:hypothetical protein
MSKARNCLECLAQFLTPRSGIPYNPAPLPQPSQQPEMDIFFDCGQVRYVATGRAIVSNFLLSSLPPETLLVDHGFDPKSGPNNQQSADSHLFVTVLPAEHGVPVTISWIAECLARMEKDDVYRQEDFLHGVVLTDLEPWQTVTPECRQFFNMLEIQRRTCRPVPTYTVTTCSGTSAASMMTINGPFSQH